MAPQTTIQCMTCNKGFKTPKALQDHQRAKLHCFCTPCDRVFGTQQALEMHNQSSIHVSHYHCCDCDQDFKSRSALDQHLLDKVHKLPEASKQPAVPKVASQHQCLPCGRNFGSKNALAQHLRDKVHGESTKKCDECPMTFLSAKALRQHKGSPKHKPLSDLRCIASKKCKVRFSTPSGLIQHLESGGCRSGMTREKLNELVRDNDKDRVISFDEEEEKSVGAGNSHVGCSSTESLQELVAASPPSVDDDTHSLQHSISESSHASDSSSSWDIIPTPSSEQGSLASPMRSSSPHSSEAVTASSDLAKSSPNQEDLVEKVNTLTTALLSGMRCPLCPEGSKRFYSAAALQDHSISPAHAPQIFHCPLDILGEDQGKKAEMKTFSTLSGLAQHLETGACRGGAKGLGKAVAVLEDRLRDLGLGNVRLLKESPMVGSPQ